MSDRPKYIYITDGPESQVPSRFLYQWSDEKHGDFVNGYLRLPPVHAVMPESPGWYWFEGVRMAMVYGPEDRQSLLCVGFGQLMPAEAGRPQAQFYIHGFGYSKDEMEGTWMGPFNLMDLLDADIAAGNQ